MISIQHAIMKMRTAKKPFELKFVRGSGARRGSIKVVEYATYGYGDYGFKTRGQYNSKAGSVKSRVSHKYSGTIPISDFDTGTLLTPLVSHIIELDGVKIKH